LRLISTKPEAMASDAVDTDDILLGFVAVPDKSE
jgi:hypothetical protein